MARTLAKAARMPRVDFSEGFTRGNNPVYVFGGLLTERQFNAGDFALNFLNTPPPLDIFRTQFSAGRRAAGKAGPDFWIPGVRPCSDLKSAAAPRLGCGIAARCHCPSFNPKSRSFACLSCQNGPLLLGHSVHLSFVFIHIPASNRQKKSSLCE
jgi:hypothetical protein